MKLTWDDVVELRNILFAYRKDYAGMIEGMHLEKRYEDLDEKLNDLKHEIYMKEKAAAQ